MVAYLLLGILFILVVYFSYQSYQEYRKHPSRWLHILLGESVGEALLHLIK